MAGKTGVYPCYKNQFQVGDAKEGATSIADMEEWYPFDTEGWARRLATAKSITISVSGKRNIGDTGNDYVFNKTFKNGRDAEGYFGWTFPDGTIISWDAAVYNITNTGAGKSTEVGPLEFDVMSNGKPTITLPSGGDA